MGHDCEAVVELRDVARHQVDVKGTSEVGQILDGELVVAGAGSEATDIDAERGAGLLGVGPCVTDDVEHPCTAVATREESTPTIKHVSNDLGVAITDNGARLGIKKSIDVELIPTLYDTSLVYDPRCLELAAGNCPSLPPTWFRKETRILDVLSPTVSRGSRVEYEAVAVGGGGPMGRIIEPSSARSLYVPAFSIARFLIRKLALR